MLCLAIGVVRANCCKRQRLSLRIAGVHSTFGFEDADVCVVALDDNAHSFGIAFKSFLGFYINALPSAPPFVTTLYFTVDIVVNFYYLSRY